MFPYHVDGRPFESQVFRRLHEGGLEIGEGRVLAEEGDQRIPELPDALFGEIFGRLFPHQILRMRQNGAVVMHAAEVAPRGVVVVFFVAGGEGVVEGGSIAV